MDKIELTQKEFEELYKITPLELTQEEKETLETDETPATDTTEGKIESEIDQEEALLNSVGWKKEDEVETY